MMKIGRLPPNYSLSAEWLTGSSWEQKPNKILYHF